MNDIEFNSEKEGNALGLIKPNIIPSDRPVPNGNGKLILN